MQSRLLYLTLAMGIFIAIIIGYFFASIVRYHRRYVKLQKERLEAEIQIQENERKRIANDLHDSFGPMLAAVKINISCLSSTNIKDDEVIQKSSKYIDEIITNLRRISYNLLPNTLERKGVLEALREFIQNLQDKHNLHFEADLVDEISLPKEKGVHLFRIMQEIIHNTLKHSKATVMKIKITEQNNLLQVQTEDNGVGFDTGEDIRQSNGLGLMSIKSRVGLLSGQLTINSFPARGTAYIIKIPL